MRTFILRARKVKTTWQDLSSHIGNKAHVEVIAHAVMNAFFISNDFRNDVEFYIVLDSTENFPRTIKLSSNEGLSFAGFHEKAILDVIQYALQQSHDLQKDETRKIAPGIQVSGFGFEKLASHLLQSKTLYLLDKKGEDIRTMTFPPDPVFILTDHLSMPANSVKGLKRHGLKIVSLGKKILFASQCVVLIQHELDRK